MGHWTIPYNWENDMKGYRYTRPTPNTAEDRTGKKKCPAVGNADLDGLREEAEHYTIGKASGFICIYFDVQGAHELVLSGR